MAASRFPLLQATCSGVRLLAETQSVLAPALISISTTSLLPPLAAQCSAVSPGNIHGVIKAIRIFGLGKFQRQFEEKCVKKKLAMFSC